MNDDLSSLLALLKERAFQEKEVTLASGLKSNFYIDVKRVSLTADGSVLLGRCLYQALNTEFPEAVAVGGLTLGADPLVTAVSYTSYLEGRSVDAFIVRKEPKGHGMGRLIEGGDQLKPQSPVVILEDVVTTGGSGLDAARKAQAHGWKVLGILAVVDRSEGGREAVEAAGFALFSLFEKSHFLKG